MKKKLIIIILVGVISSIIIYYFTLNNKVNLLALGDGLASGMTAYNVNGYSYNDYLKDYFKKENNLANYNNSFAAANLETKELINMIKSNYNININGKSITIQQTISEANIIIIGIGIDELANKSLNNELTKKYINEYINNMEEIFKLIKKYNHNKVIVLGIYDIYNINSETINQKIEKITKEYNYQFLDISKIVNNSEYYFNNSSYYLNYKGHKKINTILQKMI